MFLWKVYKTILILISRLDNKKSKVLCAYSFVYSCSICVVFERSYSFCLLFSEKSNTYTNVLNHSNFSFLDLNLTVCTHNWHKNLFEVWLTLRTCTSTKLWNYVKLNRVFVPVVCTYCQNEGQEFRTFLCAFIFF